MPDGSEVGMRMPGRFGYWEKSARVDHLSGQLEPSKLLFQYQEAS